MKIGKYLLRSMIVVVLALAVCLPARATDVYLSLSTHGQRMETGLAGFVPVSQTVDEARYCRQMQDVVRNDILFSRYFNLIEDGPLYTGKPEELKDWENRGVNMLIAGNVQAGGETLTLTGQLVDVGSGQKIWEKKYTGTPAEFRVLAHRMSDDIVLRFTGEQGIAHSRIVFSNRRANSRFKELWLVDYDGANLRRVMVDNSINILPRWSPAGDEIIYTTYRYGNPDLYSISPKGDRRRPVSRLQGLNTAGAFSYDGSKIAITLSRGEFPNLFLITRTGNIIKRLSTNRCIDTSPSFAPNGKEIVFISDRGGYPQLYLMDTEGGNVRRITTGGYCDSPAWSPRGDKIVFTMRLGRDNFDLYVYDLSSARTTRLTQDEGNNENPCWSPDGRFIAFSSTRTGRSELYIMAVDGSGVRKVGDIPGFSSTPSWSP
jgi:TolB protein